MFTWYFFGIIFHALRSISEQTSTTTQMFTFNKTLCSMILKAYNGCVSVHWTKNSSVINLARTEFIQQLASSACAFCVNQRIILAGSNYIAFEGEPLRLTCRQCNGVAKNSSQTRIFDLQWKYANCVYPWNYAARLPRNFIHDFTWMDTNTICLLKAINYSAHLLVPHFRLMEYSHTVVTVNTCLAEKISRSTISTPVNSADLLLT